MSDEIYFKEELEEYKVSELKDLIDDFAQRRNITINMADYPKNTKEYLIQAILEHQDDDKNVEEPEEEEEEEEEVEEVIPPEVPKVAAVAPTVVAPKVVVEASLPDWRDLPDRTPEEWVRKMYIKLLKREPDPRGFAGYVAHIRKGIKKHKIEAAVMNSDEFKKLNRV